MDFILKIIFLFLLILLIIFYKNIHTYETYSNISIKDKKMINTTIEKLLIRIDKLELMLHNTENHDEIKNKIEKLEKKYNSSFIWYKKYELRQKKKADEVKKNMIKNLI
tara:strand:+ start:759 stop:1085 length:327 start_codon:yes stop_codon:yes gene_type:complete